MVNPQQRFTASDGCNTHSRLPVGSQCVGSYSTSPVLLLLPSFFSVLRLFAPSDLPPPPLWRHLAASPRVNTNMRLAALRKQFQSQSLIIISHSTPGCHQVTHQLHPNAFEKFPPTFSHIYKTHNWANKLSATIKNDHYLFIYLCIRCGGHKIHVLWGLSSVAQMEFKRN